MSHRRLNSKDRTRDISARGIRKFSYASLRIATNNFSNDRLIGMGGSARIYKGILHNGTLVAIKKYHQANQPEYELEFLHVVEVMSHIQHKNINQVLGCCIENNHRLLVTEYADNGSVADILQDPKRKDWNLRASICIGIARGLSYLHEDANPHVIHRDIKSSNILLDGNFTPKISDFDIVDFFCDYDELPHEAAVVGSLVYLDPQYCVTLQYSEKVDVYAFGVVMLEIICGRSALDMELDFDDQLITGWVSRLVENDRVLEIVDPELKDFHVDDVQMFLDVALLCTQREGSRRPSMNEVVLMLHGVCNSCRRILRKFDMPTDTSDVGSISLTGYSVEASTGERKTEEGKESSILKSEGNSKLTAGESADAKVDSSRNLQADQIDDQMNDISVGKARKFSYGLLWIATNYFSDNMLIGHGGYAKVYRARSDSSSCSESKTSAQQQPKLKQSAEIGYLSLWL